MIDDSNNEIKYLDENNTEKSNNSSHIGEMPFQIEQISNNLIDVTKNQDEGISTQQEIGSNEIINYNKETKNEEISIKQENSNNEIDFNGEKAQNEEILIKQENSNEEINFNGEETQNEEISIKQENSNEEINFNGEETQSEDVSIKQENSNNEIDFNGEETQNEEVSIKQENDNDEFIFNGEETQNEEISIKQENSNDEINFNGEETQNEEIKLNFEGEKDISQKGNEAAIRNMEKRYKESKMRSSSHSKSKITFCKLPPSSKVSRSVTRPKTSTMVTYPKSLRPPSLYNPKLMNYKDREIFEEMQKKKFDEMLQDKYYIKSIHSPYKCNLCSLRKKSIKKTKLELEIRDTRDRRERFISTKNYLREVRESMNHDEKLVKKDYFPLADKSLRILAV